MPLPLRHHIPIRALAALVLLLVLPCVRAGTIIAMDADLSMLSKTLDGVVLNTAVASTPETSLVNVLLQRCIVAGGGLSVNGTASDAAPGLPAMFLTILDTNVTDATLVFRNYIPSASLVRIVNVDATMTGSTPLFDLQKFSLKAGGGSSMTIQRVRATWGTGGGGSVVQVGGPDDFSTLTGKAFSVSDAVVTGAAHVLEITPNCTANYCFDTSGGLNAFDLIESRDARGAFLYSNTPGVAVSSSGGGMIRFSNITMTGGQSFLLIDPETASSVINTASGNMVFSAISSDGPLFSLTPGQSVCASNINVKYTFRHINVAAVMPKLTAYTANIPHECSIPATSNKWNFYMGNITVAGALVDSIDVLENRYQLFASQLVGAYGEVIAVREDANYQQPTLGSAAAVNCVTERDDNVAFVELVPGVQRAECNCRSEFNAPYCTTAIDPLVYYDAYSPSPATCGVVNCDACLFGQPSQCGACALGYGLTASLGCDKIPCNVANCKGCTTDNVCGACAESYVLTSTSTCAKCTVSRCSQCAAPSDGTKCATCADGYKLNDKSQCKKKGTPWWVWLIVGIAAAAVVAGVIVLVVCCLRRRRKTAEAEANEYDATTGAGNLVHTAWGVPMAMDAARPAQAAPASPQKTRSGDTPKVRTAWVSPAVIDDPPTQSTHSASRHGRSADCHAVRAAQEAETFVTNPLEYTYRYPFEGYMEEARSPSRDGTSDVESRVEHPIPPTTTRHREEEMSSQDST